MAKRTRSGDKELLRLARLRFKQAEDADQKQRVREQEDLGFYAGETQWPDDIKQARAGGPAGAGMPETPARPCLTINKTREPVRQVLNQERGSEMGVELVPADDFGELQEPIGDDEIKLREGLVRRIQRESEAQDARTWAFARAVQAGRGFYGISTRYVNGKTRDQEIIHRRFWNQACVSIDPAHEQPDGSDAEWGFIGTDLRWDAYRAEYPRAANGAKNPIIDATDTEFRALMDEAPGWFTREGDARMCRVVEYYYTERETRDLAMLADGRDVWEDELTDADAAQDYDTRPVVTKTVKWAKIDGSQVLDETDWPGQFIPIVKVLGEELQPFDNERRVEGMVRPMREPGQGFNYMVSKWVETIALSPIAPLMLAEGQSEGYEAWYAAANTRTLPYLPYKLTDLEGRAAPPPFTTPRDVSGVIGALGMSVQMFSEALQSVSSIHDPSLGKVDHSTKSGVAIRALQQQGQQGTSNYLDNLTRSIRYEGKIINDLLFPIYGRPGRIARILNGENEPESVMLHQPFVQQGGRPVAAPHDENAKTYTLTKDAQFNVVVKATRAYDLRREQESATVGELIQSAPMLMTWFGDLFFKNQDGPGHEQMADRAKAMLDPRIQQMLQAKEQGQAAPNPETQHLQGQVQQLTQQLQQAAQQIQNDTAKYEAQKQIEQFKAGANRDLQITLTTMNNAAKIEMARISAAKQSADLAREDAEERTALHLEQAHELGMQAHDQAHQAGMAQAGLDAQAQQQAAGHQQALEQQAAGAALQPAPEGGAE